jgi:hypothetical protein
MKLKYDKSNHLLGTVSLEHGKANKNNKPFIASVDGHVVGIFPPTDPKVGIFSHQELGVDIRSVQMEFGYLDIYNAKNIVIYPLLSENH